MLEKLKEEPARLIVWAVAFVCATILVSLGKAPHSTFEYLLIYMAGALQSGKKAQNNATG